MLLLVVGVPLLYTRVLNDDQPERLSFPAVTTSAAAAAPSSAAAELSDAETSSAASSSTGSAAVAESAPAGASLNGEWTVGAESVVG